MTEELQVQNSSNDGKNWLATMLLCWFLGAFGAHRFYTGKTGTAWAMAIMTITGCFAAVSLIWAIFDGFVIALGNWRHEDGSELYERIEWVGYAYMIIVALGFFGSLIFGGSLLALFTTILSGAGISGI